MSGTLHEDRRTFYCCRRHYTDINALSATEIVSGSHSVRISAAPTGQIYVNFNNGDFYENLSQNSKFG